MLDLVIEGTRKDLGGLEARPRSAVCAPTDGWAIHFSGITWGRPTFALVKWIDVRPHPHIGLSTVTYLFDGEIHHRDSLGVSQKIRPGEVNWMTAGSGIVHSERAWTHRCDRAAVRCTGCRYAVALPREDEEVAPAFAHHAADALPELSDHGVWARLIAGFCLRPEQRCESLFAAVLSGMPNSAACRCQNRDAESDHA